MPDCCVLYITDTTYLFPTLVSAMQARRHCSTEKADVIIFYVAEESVEDIFAPVCALENIGFVQIDSALIEGQSAMLARLFLDRFVPARYTQFLYLDGDVQVLGSLDPLIDADVPEGHFLAANDPMTFLLADKGEQSRDLSQHLKEMGLTPEQALGYFNSGVLRINRKGWNDIGQRAWEVYQRISGPARFADQDALNIVAGDRRLAMSLAWNFPVFLLNSRVESQIKPTIMHFMSNPKPWDGSFQPWRREACMPYADAVRMYPALSPFAVQMPIHRKSAYYLQQYGKKLLETITWGFSQRRHRVLGYEASARRNVGRL